MDTKGYCFLCLIKLEAGLGGLSSSSSTQSQEDEEVTDSNCDIQRLVRYLEVDMRKVFMDSKDQDKDDVLNNCKLMVTLCEGCSIMNDDFLDLHGQLEDAVEEDNDNEETEMEIAYCLKLIHGKLVKSEETGRNTEFQKKFISSEEIKIALMLRIEVMQKCSLKLNSILSGDGDQDQDDEDENEETLEDSEEGTPVIDNIIKQEPPDSDDSNLKSDDEDDEEEQPSDSAQEKEDDTKYDIDMEKDFTEVQIPVPPDQAPASETDDSSKYLLVLHTSSSLSQDETCKPKKDAAKGTYNCSMCPKTFKHDIDATRHYQSFHLQLKLQCGLCKLTFKRQPSYSTHFRVTHQGYRFKCRKCNKLFNEKAFIKQHITAHYGKRLPCPFCPQTFKYSSCRSRHLARRCPVKFGRKGMGRGPSSTTGPPRPSTSAPKRKKRPNAVQDTSFITTVMPESDSPKRRQKDLSTFISTSGKFQCVLCPRQYGTPKLAAQHYKSSHLQIRFQCQPCGKIFHNKQNCILHHQKTHLIKQEPEETPTCPTCGKVFSSQANLKRHQSQSPHCGGGDSDETARKRVSHCKVCGLGFNHKFSLDKHVKAVHLKVRNHRCSVCRHKFFAKGNLTRHMRKVHPEEECDEEEDEERK